MRAHGMFVVPDIDKTGERFELGGLDLTPLVGGPVYSADFSTVIGQVTAAWVDGDGVHGEVEITDPAMDLVVTSGVPFYFAVQGLILERTENVLRRALIQGVALTRFGVHEGLRVQAGPKP